MSVLDQACAAAGINARDARELSARANRVYLLPKAQAVARLRRTYGSAEWAKRLTASVRVTHWLDDRGVPVTVPLDVEQPVVVDGWAATFWHHVDIDEAAPAADVVD